MLDHYSIEKIAYAKIAGERETAARYWLSVRAKQAGSATRQGVTSPLAGLVRAIAHVFGHVPPALANRLRVQ